MATEYGRVVSSTPVTAQVQVPQQQCSDQQQQVPTRPSGAGAVIGAVIGGVVGHNLGDGFGRAAATGLGVVAGSVIGDRVEAANTPPTDVAVRNCQNWTRLENRLIGYDVVYEYQGRRFATRLAQDPGQSIALNVNVVPASDVAAQAPPDAPNALGAPQGW
ncbi:glycine zipper 2TM domain-containing protein [Roseateles sp. GG27B]